MSRGLKRLLRSITWKIFPHADLRLRTPVRRFYIPVRKLTDFASLQEIFIERTYAAFLPQLTGITSWVDLGCNSGYFSLNLLDSVEHPEGCHALLVDAHPICCQTARAAVEVNGLNTRFAVINQLVGPAAASAEFFQARGTQGSSIFKPEAKAKAVHVPSAPFGKVLSWHVLPGRDLVKIDIEGAEKHLFENEADVLATFRYGLAEWHAPHWTGEQMRDWLFKRNARILAVQSSGLETGAGAQDSFDGRLGVVLWRTASER